MWQIEADSAQYKSEKQLWEGNVKNVRDIYSLVNI